jgi:hypothetical protein
MSLNFLAPRHDDPVSQLRRQVSSLRRQIDGLSREASRTGRHAASDLGDSASELFDDAWEHGRDAAQQIARQAAHVGTAVRKDPVPTLVAVGTLALVASILLARSR